MYGANLIIQHPRRFVRSNTRMYQHGLMAADRIKGQSRAGIIHFADFSVRHQSKLNQCLEPVTDTEHQTVTDIEQFHHALFNARITEKCGDKFTRTIRLVTAGEIHPAA